MAATQRKTKAAKTDKARARKNTAGASTARRAAASTSSSTIKRSTVRVDAPREGLNGPNPELMKKQAGIWDTLMDRYFRLEIDGWERLPKEPVLLIGVHSGGSLTMDAWTVIMAWWRQFGETRSLHGTAHDLLM